MEIVGYISQDVRVTQDDACYLFNDLSKCSVRCRWLFTEISVMNMDYACSAIAWASRMLELLRKEEVEPLEREDKNCSQFPVSTTVNTSKKSCFINTAIALPFARA